MEIRPIRTEADYEGALQKIAALMEAQPEIGSEEFDCLDILATLVEAYEDKHYAIGLADPVETIRFHLDRLGWTQAELARQADIQPTHLSAVLNRRRSLSLAQIKKLSALFAIPADQLIDNEYQTDDDRPGFRA